MKAKSESEVAQSCLTLSDPMDCSPPGSSIHGIFQAGVLEWGAIALVVRNSPANAEDVRKTGSIPRLGRSLGGGHVNPLQYGVSTLKIPMDRAASGLQSMESQESDMTKAT